MRSIWLTGSDEDKLISTGEFIGEELINRNQSIELIVQSEVREILGRGLKDSPEDKATFTDRLGFLGNMLNRNNIFTIIISMESSDADKNKVKESYGNYLEFKVSKDPKEAAKEVITKLISEKLIPEQCQEVYSEEEEEEIRKRLEDLGYV
jgi:adenylylsulfate kinase-like enzyme